LVSAWFTGGLTLSSHLLQHLRKLPRHLPVAVLHDLRLDPAVLHRPKFLVFPVCLQQVLAEFRFGRVMHPCMRLVEELLDDATIGIAEGEDGAAGISPIL